MLFFHKYVTSATVLKSEWDIGHRGNIRDETDQKIRLSDMFISIQHPKLSIKKEPTNGHIYKYCLYYRKSISLSNTGEILDGEYLQVLVLHFRDTLQNGEIAQEKTKRNSGVGYKQIKKSFFEWDYRICQYSILQSIFNVGENRPAIPTAEAQNEILVLLTLLVEEVFLPSSSKI